MKTALIVIAAFVAVIILGALGFVCDYAGRAAQVVSEETDPRTLLDRYEWFKEVSAELDRKAVDIAYHESRMTSIEEAYQGGRRSEWSRQDREQYNLWSSEVAGMIASYNGLAAEYNANMAKINYRFTNRGDLPAGATEPLSREVRPYRGSEE